MKTLYLVRHAKSSWDNPALRDFERPLNERGKRDAPRMGRRLHKRHIQPGLILSSTAKRAEKTAKMLAKELKYDEKNIRFADSLYHAKPEEILRVLEQLPDNIHSVMVVGHNPGLTDFANEYIDLRIDNIPTCGVVAAQFDVASWKDVVGVKGKFKFFDYPKQTSD